MPAFTFEKISPPPSRGQLPATAKKQRGVIVQVLDRFVGVRAERTATEENSAAVGEQKTSE